MKWFKNLRTMPKLMLGFGFLVLLMAVIGIQGIMGMGSINAMLDTIYVRDLNGVEAVKDIDAIIAKIGREARQAVIDQDKSEMQADEQRIEAYFVAADRALSAADRAFYTDEGKAALARIRAALAEYRVLVKDCIRLTLINDNKAAAGVLIKGRVVGNQLAQAAADAISLKDKVSKRAYDESKEVYTRLSTAMLGMMLFSVVLALSLGVFLARLVSGPMARAVEAFRALAGGDLTCKLTVDTKDEVGQMAQAMNTAVEGMREALTEVQASAETVTEAAQQLASSSEELSSGAQEQASSLEETSSSLEQITSSVRQNADSAKQANQLATLARDSAEKGGQVVSAAVAAMGEINTASKKIADIITAIDEIAFQTNLLALNAAVEAARAGEQGRGFAVVAAEVRSLAQRSATAAKEIKALIQDSVRKVESGSEMVNKSGQVLLEIVASVKRVTDIVGEIAAASQEQASGVEQVGNAVSQMDQVTQQNAAQTEELSSTAEGLSSSAEELQAMVARFKLSDERDLRQHRAKARSAEPTLMRSKPKPRMAPAVASRPVTPHKGEAEHLVALGAAVGGAVEDGKAGGFEEF